VKGPLSIVQVIRTKVALINADYQRLFQEQLRDQSAYPQPLVIKGRILIANAGTILLGVLELEDGLEETLDC
jgi:hypothetical protein